MLFLFYLFPLRLISEGPIELVALKFFAIRLQLNLMLQCQVEVLHRHLIKFQFLHILRQSWFWFHTKKRRGEGAQ